MIEIQFRHNSLSDNAWKEYATSHTYEAKNGTLFQLKKEEVRIENFVFSHRSEGCDVYGLLTPTGINWEFRFVELTKPKESPWKIGLNENV